MSLKTLLATEILYRYLYIKILPRKKVDFLQPYVVIKIHTHFYFLFGNLVELTERNNHFRKAPMDFEKLCVKLRNHRLFFVKVILVKHFFTKQQYLQYAICRDNGVKLDEAVNAVY